MIVFWLFLGAALLVLGQRWVYARFWRRRLTVRVRFDRDTAAVGESVILNEQILNRKRLPLPMLQYRYTLLRNFELVREKDEKPIRISRRLAVPGRRSVRCSFTLDGLRRGVYTLTEASLTGQDLFYTLSDTKPFHPTARLTVWPEKLEFSRLAVPYRRLLGQVLTRRRTQEDPFELRGIRPYEPTDSMRLINWKATARTGELKVNQHEHTTDEALLLILDTEHGSTAERETVISAASSLAALFLQRGVSVALASNGRSCVSGREIRLSAGSGAAHLQAIDGELAQIKLGASVTRSFSDLLCALREQRVDALCVAISAGGGDEIGAAFDALCAVTGGCYLQVGEETVSGRHFTVLPFEGRREAAS